MKNVKLINNVLNKEIKEILENNYTITKGGVGGFSIEVEESTRRCYNSYIYLSEKDRDLDLKSIVELLK